jgi:ATP-binding cassette, subfamily B, bacterial
MTRPELGLRHLLVMYLRPHRRAVGLLGIVLVVSIGLQLASPQVLQRFIDAAGKQPMDELLRLAVMFIALAIANQVFAVIAIYMGEQIGWRATNAMREDLALHCLRLDMPFHKTLTPGALAERIDGDVKALAEFFAFFVVRIVANAVLLVGILVALGIENWRMSAVFGLFSLVAMFTLIRLQGAATSHWHATRRHSADLYGLLDESFAGAEDLRGNGAHAYVMRRFFTHARAFFRAKRTGRFIESVLWCTTTLLFAIAAVLALALGGYLYFQGEMTIGSIVLVFFYAEMLRRPIEEITQRVEDLQRAAAGVQRIQELWRMQSALGDGTRSLPADGPVEVALEDVSFAYEAGEPVLHRVSLTVPPGRVLGVVGRTGSGKSTLARLLVRLYDPAEGSIRLNGVELREIRLAEQRVRTALVSQDVRIIRGTVRENITLFDDSVPAQRLAQVLEDLGLGDWLRSLPDGLDTMLSPGGRGISAGEAQLLALARVFLTSPALVVLDEASSRLDPALEAQVQRAIRRLMEGRTGVIIAHKLETLRWVDDILVLQDGRVVEHGSREQFMRNSDAIHARLLASDGGARS